MKWVLLSEQAPDDEIRVLMALSNHEVEEGFLLDGQWRFVSWDLCEDVPTHWMDIPRHPMDSAP